MHKADVQFVVLDPVGVWFGLRLVLLTHGQGKDMARDDIDSTTGHKRSSRDAYLARLKARGLVTFGSRGFVRASEELFD